MKIYRNSIIFLFTILLAGCVFMRPKAQAWLTKEIKVNLPELTGIIDYHDQQLLTFKYKNNQHSLITLLDIKDDKITVVGLSTLGIRLFKIDYFSNNINIEQNIFIKELPPASQILSDIMLSIYPIENWKAVLPKNWKIIENNQRRILYNDKSDIIAEITYGEKQSSNIKKPINIKHYIFDYQISIKNME